MGHSEFESAAKERRPWNVGRMVSAKRAPKPQQVWAIGFWTDRNAGYATVPRRNGRHTNSSVTGGAPTPILSRQRGRAAFIHGA